MIRIPYSAETHKALLLRIVSTDWAGRKALVHRKAGNFPAILLLILKRGERRNLWLKKQILTHGRCVNAGSTIPYEAGTISIMQAGVPHEVLASSEGLYLFAKFMPALC